jgi:ABC-type amino acid transport substrate-binding protein
VQLFATGIPSVVGGIRSTIRLELVNAGLPEDLISVFFLNGEWIYRVEKTLAMLGMVAMVLAVVAHSRGMLTLRLRPALVGLLATTLLTIGLTVGTRALLSQTLAGTYSGASTMMTLDPLIAASAPVIRDAQPLPDTVSLASIRTRGVLRVGVRAESLPWAYHRADGRLVGYDVDVITALAEHLGVRAEFYEAPLGTLEQWITQQRIDVAIGGILDSPMRSAMFNSSDGYQQVHRALVVHDDHVRAVQDRSSRGPLRIATADSEPMTDDVLRALARSLGSDEQPAQVHVVRIQSHAEFLRDTTHRIADALLTTAEGGATWSVVYPRTSMLAVLGNTVPAQCVILQAGDDANLREYVQQWMIEQRLSAMFDRLFTHWIAR